MGTLSRAYAQNTVVARRTLEYSFVRNHGIEVLGSNIVAATERGELRLLAGSLLEPWASV